MKKVLGICLTGVVLAASSQATVISLSSVEDTYTAQDVADNNFGGSVDIELGAPGSGAARVGLFRFDVSPLAGLYTSINSITMQMTLKSNTGDREFNVNLIVEGNESWVEGTSDDAIEAGAASWNWRNYDTTPWITSSGRTGGDIYGSMYFMEVPSTTPVGQVYSMLLDPSSLAANVDTATEIIDLWQTTNAGISLYNNGAGNSGVQAFHSSEAAVFGDRPMLIVDYVAIPEPSTLALIGLGLGAMVLRRRRG